MSQHVLALQTGEQVLAGYDRRLGEYFYSVFASEEDDAPRIESRAGSGPRTIEALRAQLGLHVPNVPGEMYESIRLDALNNVGNRLVKWTINGSLISDSFLGKAA